MLFILNPQKIHQLSGIFIFQNCPGHYALTFRPFQSLENQGKIQDFPGDGVHKLHSTVAQKHWPIKIQISNEKRLTKTQFTILTILQTTTS